ncbi:MAG: metal-sensing transcriptional repressor [Spirochaetales bacterium]|jgi:DNA-binding FrmR family transcriptional regulator
MDHGSAESKKALTLLKTAKGQVEAAIRMIEEDRYCIDVSKQILASAALLKKANLVVLRQHIDTCVKDAVNNDKGQEKIEEIATILERYLGDSGN